MYNDPAKCVNHAQHLHDNQPEMEQTNQWPERWKWHRTRSFVEYQRLGFFKLLFGANYKYLKT